MKLCARKCKISLDEIYQSENFDPIGRNWKSVTDFCALIPTLLVRVHSGFEFQAGHANQNTTLFPSLSKRADKNRGKLRYVVLCPTYSNNLGTVSIGNSVPWKIILRSKALLLRSRFFFQTRIVLLDYLNR